MNHQISSQKLPLWQKYNNIPSSCYPLPQQIVSVRYFLLVTSMTYILNLTNKRMVFTVIIEGSILTCHSCSCNTQTAIKQCRHVN